MNLEQAKAVCRAMPAASEDIKWGSNVVFSVGLKMFAIFGGSEAAPTLSFKVEDERFLELTDRPGIIPAPYLARAKWVQIARPKALGDAEAAALLRRAHGLIVAKLSKKLQREIGGQDQ
ncbi:MmcQ/YjbR family DNA-binding protein [Janthinobacterium fluminis]|uniref:MmcQ/YjbR family DNA-binding protein n=1 Tax=Janthinobacterium fluminis TaxID=2987524 RepID=A0ABT5JZ56_9BURK|nr:MmcQ/YjbR family DNA-binding protein [Janthinobacterium fluminis]MDC8757761.1 MmcQ/YjbR family DNA-binding protein [Janthinobacterium fluminis]